MGFLSKMLGGEDSKVESAPNYSAAEQAMRDKVANYLSGKIGSTATAYSGKTLADTPALFGEAVSQFDDLSNMFTDPANNSLMQLLSGKSAYNPQNVDISKYWEQNLATPAMTVWKNTIGADLEASMGSGLFNTRKGQAVSREAGNYYNTNVVSQLFNAQQLERQLQVTSQENALNRQAAATDFAYSMPAMQFQNMMTVSNAIQNQEQMKLTDAYNRFLRMTEEESPWLKLATGYAGSLSPSYYTVGFQGSEGALGGILAGAGIGALGGSMGLFGTGVTAGGGAALGALAGI